MQHVSNSKEVWRGKKTQMSILGELLDSFCCICMTECDVVMLKMSVFFFKLCKMSCVMLCYTRRAKCNTIEHASFSVRL